MGRSGKAIGLQEIASASNIAGLFVFLRLRRYKDKRENKATTESNCPQADDEISRKGLKSRNIQALRVHFLLAPILFNIILTKYARHMLDAISGSLIARLKSRRFGMKLKEKR